MSDPPKQPNDNQASSITAQDDISIEDESPQYITGTSRKCENTHTNDIEEDNNEIRF